MVNFYKNQQIIDQLFAEKQEGPNVILWDSFSYFNIFYSVIVLADIVR